MPDCNHDCSSCGVDCAERTDGGIQKTPMNNHSNIKRVIGVVSGKGGVGKSSVTAMLASASRARGLNTAVLDADVTGPSIPSAFGTFDQPYGNEEEQIIPVKTKTGIEIMSTNLLLENHTDPVIWRGPVLGGVINQFWKDCVWGDIDVMYVDMPPGTGDVPLTVYQNLPVDGIVIVTSPQQMVSMIVEKAVNMARMMDIPVLAVVENMSYFKCPDCGGIHKIFGESHIEDISAKFGIKDTVRLPIEPEIAKAVDDGTVEDHVAPELVELEKKLNQ